MTVVWLLDVNTCYKWKYCMIPGMSPTAESTKATQNLEG
jgi:hypothetical protein